jgi:DNA-binding NarL/FixJ family response regulator
MPDIRVLLVDDRPVVQTGIRSMLGRPGIEVVGAVAGIDEAVTVARHLKPTMILLSSQNSGTHAAAATARLMRVLTPPPRVLVLANSVDEDGYRAIRAGAVGLLLEQSSQTALVSAVRVAASGHLVLAPPTVAPSSASPVESRRSGSCPSRLELLTLREYDVFELIACGRSNADISESLSLSENTVKSHVRSVLSKLGLRNRVEATIYAHEVALVRSRTSAEG